MAIDLEGTGLALLGHCQLNQADGLPHDAGTLLLLGPDEPAFWPLFKASPERNDGQPDPLDRWSKRIVGQLAIAANGIAYYPFGDAPFHPFYSWALRSGNAWPSPIGFLVHADRGLFVSYRGAIWVPETHAATDGTAPCETCAAPCKKACPVGAFDAGYDVDACRAHIATPQGTSCITQGCAARRACPVGAGIREPAQSAFHMEAFR
tara:strand:+ start:11472 stop:12092 length:621 start_codon:yes stop_codon:yes gene_type:complete